MLKLLLIGIVFFPLPSHSQELFVNSESASTLPARSLGVKLSGYHVSYDKVFDRPADRYSGEIMVGLYKKISVRAGIGFSNMHTSSFKRESFFLFGKYRFFSVDEIHRHFRMAAFLSASYSYALFHYDEVELMGDKTGVAVGIIATQLSNKFALSGTVSHSQLLDSSRFNDVVYLPTRIYQAINYSLSSGYLLFPREYKNFNQLNVSVFLELLAQQTISPGKYYFDLAPAAQFILNSNLKLNLSYRAQLSSDMQRISKNKWQFSVERTFLNAFPKNKKAS